MLLVRLLFVSLFLFLLGGLLLFLRGGLLFLSRRGLLRFRVPLRICLRGLGLRRGRGGAFPFFRPPHPGGGLPPSGRPLLCLPVRSFFAGVGGLCFRRQRPPLSLV